MKCILLYFCKIVFLEKEKIAEIIINDGELLNQEKVTELHRVLLSHFNSTFYLLINKEHSYCYTYKAQLILADISSIKAIAIVNYSKTSEKSTNFTMSFGKKSMIKHQKFYQRESAINWLRSVNGI